MKPNFICIGAPKTSTTWIYKNLSQHPQVHVTPVKELRYFDRIHPIPSPKWELVKPRGLLGIFSDYPREQILRRFGRSLSRPSISEVLWLMKYFRKFDKHASDDWYVSLFNPPTGKITGEFTTGYCALSTEGVNHCRELLPDAKIIFFMRDPIERAWSNAKMLVPKMLSKPANSISEDEYLEYLHDPAPKLRGDYLRTLRNWEAAYPSEQIFLGFYDNVVERPTDVLSDLYNFLEIRSDASVLPNKAGKRINASKGARAISMPPRIRSYLANYYLEDLTTLEQRFGNPVDRWLASAREAIDS